ncbi:ABC transporter substrate-binding protein [Chitinivorax sp. B]|uniref:ABC transporter substrate-binding protein n=1 Tax=Chitinivorax sp. B TaxID=2502235 RepID=UPI001485B4C1|nr:ABC transporter substrate-binding protein [Chitinivorax sp. B]
MSRSFTMMHRLVLTLLAVGLSASLWARNVVDAAGTAQTIPDHPQRVLVLSELDLDALLALQVTPVGTTTGRGQQGVPRYLGAAATKITLVGDFSTPVLDRVITAQPDLILAGGAPDPAMLAQLRKVAPTLVSFKPSEDWQTAFRRVAQWLGREQQADRFMTEYRARAATVRTRLAKQANATVSIVRWSPQGPAYMLKDSFASRVLADVQLVRPATQQQPGVAHSPPISLEALNRVDADWLFVGTLSTTGQAADALQVARQTPAFNQLNAVKRNQLVVVDGSLWTSLGGPLAAMAVLTDVDKAMATR